MNIRMWMPHIIFVSVLAILFGFLWFVRYKRRGRRTPLTRQLLRMPGETLKRSIDDLSDDLDSYLFAAMIMPIMIYAIYLTMPQSGKSPIIIVLVCVLVLVVESFYIFKMSKILKERNARRLGLDCELAVGQELNQLMLQGCRVYHDFPAEKFNIDHVVVSQKGVFAIETKGRAKPDKKMGTAEATVIFDGDALQFPNGNDRSYINQTKRQAAWLTKWLSSATGEPVPVQPILVLPGWYIERKKPTEIIVFNGKNPDLLLKWCRDDKLSEAAVKRIAHQIEQRCRDVEPSAYKKEAKTEKAKP